MSQQAAVLPARPSRSDHARRVLHAFPPQSEVALCGVTRKPSAEPVVAGATKRCAVCEGIAGDKWFMGR
jgi:hypothetical protein